MAYINGNEVLDAIIVRSVARDSGYMPVELLNTELTEEQTTIDIAEYNGASFNCKEFHIQLDIPAASTATAISASVKRTTNAFQGINSQNTALRTVTDTTKHTLAAFDYEQHDGVYFVARYGAQQAANNITWDNVYNNVPLLVLGHDANSLPADGTEAIRLTGLFPVGTVIKIWGEIKK